MVDQIPGQTGKQLRCTGHQRALTYVSAQLALQAGRRRHLVKLQCIQQPAHLGYLDVQAIEHLGLDQLLQNWSQTHLLIQHDTNIAAALDPSMHRDQGLGIRHDSRLLQTRDGITLDDLGSVSGGHVFPGAIGVETNIVVRVGRAQQLQLLVDSFQITPHLELQRAHSKPAHLLHQLGERRRRFIRYHCRILNTASLQPAKPVRKRRFAYLAEQVQQRQLQQRTCALLLLEARLESLAEACDIAH